MALGPLNNKQRKTEENRTLDIYLVPPLPDNLEEELRRCLGTTDEADERVLYLRWLLETLPPGSIDVVDDLIESEDANLAQIAIIIIPQLLRRAVPQDNRVFSYDELDRLRNNLADLIDSESEEVAQAAIRTFNEEADYLRQYDVTTYGWIEPLVQPPVAWERAGKRYSDDIARLTHLAVSNATAYQSYEQ